MSPNVKTSTVQGIIYPRLILFSLRGVASREGGVIIRSSMKIIKHKARDIKSGKTVLDRGTRFIIKEVRVSAEHGPIAFIDMEGVWHGVYHPDEYLGVGE
jgi:hypothetical protein